MKYNEALSLWGSDKLKKVYSSTGWEQFDNITTQIEIIEAQNCCGCSGEYPCRYESSSEANIVIAGIGTNNNGRTQSIETRISMNEYSDDFNLESFLCEILEISGGVIRNN